MAPRRKPKKEPYDSRQRSIGDFFPQSPSPIAARVRKRTENAHSRRPTQKLGVKPQTRKSITNVKKRILTNRASKRLNPGSNNSPNSANSSKSTATKNTAQKSTTAKASASSSQLRKNANVSRSQAVLPSKVQRPTSHPMDVEPSRDVVCNTSVPPAPKSRLTIDQQDANHQLRSLECSLDSTSISGRPSSKSRAMSNRASSGREFAFACVQPGGLAPRPLGNNAVQPSRTASANGVATSPGGRLPSPAAMSSQPAAPSTASAPPAPTSPTSPTSPTAPGTPQKVVTAMQSPGIGASPMVTASPVRSSAKETSGEDRKSSPSRNAEDMSESESNKSDSDSELSDGDQGRAAGWRMIIKEAALRRSTRTIKSVDRFSPGMGSAPTKSVFGDSCALWGGERRTVRGGSTEVSRLLRECKQVAARKAENDKLREDLRASEDMIENDEKEFGNMAQKEQDMDKLACEQMKRYSRALNTFRGSVHVPKLPDRFRDGASVCDDFQPLHDLFLMVENCEHVADSALSMMGLAAMSMLDDCDFQFSDFDIDLLFHLCVFDESIVSARSRGRSCREEMTNAFIRMASSKHDGTDFRDGDYHRRHSLIETLKCYGAVLVGSGEDDDSENNDCLNRNGSGMCLDDIAGIDSRKRSEKQQEVFNICIRNVNRAFRLAAAKLNNAEISFAHAIGQFEDSVAGASPLGSDIVNTVGLCTKVMLSKFGSHLKRNAGLVICSAIGRATEDEWVPLRLKIAKHVLKLTSRLNLHVELVTYLFPFNCERCLQCSLDIAYLSLTQWCGSGNLKQNQSPHDVSDMRVSSAALEFGVEEMSFCVGDIIDALNRISELDRDTDVIWACGLARLLKQLLSMPQVVARRKENEIGGLNQMIQKLRQCSHRMKFDVAVQDLRLALDALLKSIHFMCSTNKQDRQDLNPAISAPEHMKQRQLSFS